jgi:hypothetical protein|tara:strand:- start:276 stop:464 length:189 start_codon:yes stop_codon:yes gene_type:complete
MVTAKFNTTDIDSFVYSIQDFETKLMIWSTLNEYAAWEINTYIGEYNFLIEVIVDDGSELDY